MGFLNVRSTPILALVFSTQIALAQTEVVVMPSGNHNAQIPSLPSATQNRHMEKLVLAGSTEAYFDERYKLVMQKLSQKYETPEFSLKNEIKRAGQIYQINPVHILGAIVGEHTFNVDVKDNVQQYAVKLALWSGYFNGSHPFARVSQCVEMKSCETLRNSYETWSCYHSTWERKFRSQVACGGEQFSNKSLIMEFFNPTLAGKTYGLGQMGPVLVLALSDFVAEKSRFPRLSIHHVDAVYQATLNPRMTVHYIAAAIAMSIQTYKEVAGVDISTNPGVTATLYNLGGDKTRAKNLANINAMRAKKGLPMKFPEENYYGWFVNKYEAELTRYLK